MKGFVAESGVEETCLEYFADAGWQILYGPDIGPDQPGAERTSFRDVLLEGRLRAAVARLNPGLTSTAVDSVVASVRRVESADLMAESWRVHRLLTGGVPVDRRDERGELRHDVARLLDVQDVDANDFVVVNQLTVVQDGHERRPDVVAYVNGVPLAVLELKAPGQERATLGGALKQLQTYEREIPSLMSFTALSVISTGI